MEQIHKRLKSELSERGITAAAAARAAGMPDSQGLRDTLNGRKRVTADLLALLIPLGVDALYVLTGQRAGGAVTPPPERAVSEGDRILLDNFHAAPAQVQAGVKTTLGAFAPIAGTKAKRSKAA